MTTSIPEPATPSPADPAPAPPRGLLRVTPIVATVGVVVALVGLLLLLRPVTTPTQDCGTALGFLLDGRVNEIASVEDPPEGITPAEAKANKERPCRVRVVDQATPALIAFGAGLLVAVVAALTEIVARSIGWFGRRQAQRALTHHRAPPPPIA